MGLRYYHPTKVGKYEIWPWQVILPTNIPSMELCVLRVGRRLWILLSKHALGEPGVCFYRAESVIYSLLFGVKRQGMLETCEGNTTKSADHAINQQGGPILQLERV
jgi:hypothetical protein